MICKPVLGGQLPARPGAQRPLAVEALQHQSGEAGRPRGNSLLLSRGRSPTLCSAGIKPERVLEM